jgi:hypothetical protein
MNGPFPDVSEALGGNRGQRGSRPGCRSRPQRLEPIRGVGHHRAQHMAVALGHGQRGMPEDLHDNALVDAGSHQVGRHAVSQIVRPVCARQASSNKQILERFVHGALAYRLADLIGKDMAHC